MRKFSLIRMLATLLLVRGQGGWAPVSAAQLQEFDHYGRETARGLGRRRAAP